MSVDFWAGVVAGAGWGLLIGGVLGAAWLMHMAREKD